MKATVGTICAVLALGLFALTGLVVADDGKAPQGANEVIKLIEEAGKPGPEHARLEPLAGSWTYTCKLWMDPSQPPVESKGTIQRNWVLGGRFLEEHVAGTCFTGKEFEGRGLLGFDKGTRKYTSTFACTMGTGTCTGVGVADPSGTEFIFQTEAYCPVLQKVVQGREEIRIESSDRVVVTSYVTEGGKDTKVMEIVSARK